MKRITFYLDVVSPYAWLAFERLPEVLEGLSYSVEYRPVLLGALLKHEKETIYRELFAPRFSEVAGFCQFAAQVRARGLKVAVGTAGDIGNVEFALGHLGLEPAPQAIVRGDEGLPGKPQPAIFLEAARRIAADPAHCIVFEDAPFGIEAARRAGMRAVAICSTHTPEQLAGPHVLAAVRDYTELMNTDFLESIHVATV